VVVGVVKATDAGQPFHASTVTFIVLKAAGFLVAAVLLGRWLSARAFKFALRMRGEGLLLTGALAFCFGLAYLAGLAGLAPIVGAFAAGLILDEVHYQDLRQRDHARRDVPELLESISTFLVPVFFVLMGMRVDLSVFGNAGVLGFAAVLTLVAVLSKQACALGVLDRSADRLTIGLGMIPRGEVGLIFAGIGSTLTIAGQRVIDDALFSAVVAMVALTTLVTPPLLAWRLQRTKAS
jgi:Kef-type K+ transport system membrane component KefB